MADTRKYRLKNARRVLRLGESLYTGGEAEIYAVEDRPESLAKIYKEMPYEKAEERRRRLKAMLANPPKEPTAEHISFAWPTDIVEDEEKRCAGMIMPRISNSRTFKEVANAFEMQKKGIRLSLYVRLVMCYNLALAVQSAHEAFYVIGDLNDKNILVLGNSFVTLIDTDSFQMEDPKTRERFLCSVGVEEFLAPELQNQNDLRQRLRNPEEDLFSLGVLIFYMLMSGYHPFEVQYTGEGDRPTVGEMIAQGWFPYGKSGRCPYRPSEDLPSLLLLPPSIRERFVECFDLGHDKPHLRPTAKQWADTLRNAYTHEVIECAAKPKSQQDSPHFPHIYGKHLKKCPYCRLENPTYEARAKVTPPAPSPKPPAPAPKPSPFEDPEGEPVQNLDTVETGDIKADATESEAQKKQAGNGAVAQEEKKKRPLPLPPPPRRRSGVMPFLMMAALLGGGRMVWNMRSNAVPQEGVNKESQKNAEAERNRAAKLFQDLAQDKGSERTGETGSSQPPIDKPQPQTPVAPKKQEPETPKQETEAERVERKRKQIEQDYASGKLPYKDYRRQMLWMGLKPKPDPNPPAVTPKPPQPKPQLSEAERLAQENRENERLRAKLLRVTEADRKAKEEQENERLREKLKTGGNP